MLRLAVAVILPITIRTRAISKSITRASRIGVDASNLYIVVQPLAIEPVRDFATTRLRVNALYVAVVVEKKKGSTLRLSCPHIG